MNSRAPAEPYCHSFETTVEAIDDTAVFLSETYFYPEGGGQPADRGTLGDSEVVDVQQQTERIVHRLESPPAFDVGETVRGEIDTQYRRTLMRAHTASHALYGGARRLFEELGYGGFDIAGESVRVDLATPTSVDDEALVELERLTNRAVWDTRAVSWKQLPREEALSRDDIAFNTKTEEGITGDTVRIVEIDNWDVAACGGTHVENTCEIGPVSVLDRSNPGEGLTRVEFAVGETAIKRRATEASATRQTARALDTQVSSLPESVDRLLEERSQLREQVQQLREQVIEARLADLEDATISRNGQAWLAGSVPTDDANALVEFAQRLVDQTSDVVALVGQSGTYLGVATNGSVDAETVVEQITAEFGGGGGGGETAAQAGGLDGSPDEIVSFLRDGDITV